MISQSPLDKSRSWEGVVSSEAYPHFKMFMNSIGRPIELTHHDPVRSQYYVYMPADPQSRLERAIDEMREDIDG